MEPAQILAHYENTFPGIRAEWIDDQIVPKAVPGGYHSFVEFQSVLTIGTKCKGKQRSDGRGGWWLMSEVSIDYPKSKRILQADLAGWKRSRIASPPKEYPVSELPDWVCEICHSTRHKDTVIVPETLAQHDISWYWLIDLEQEELQIWQLSDEKNWNILHTFPSHAGEERLPPFDSVLLRVSDLFGIEEE